MPNYDPTSPEILARVLSSGGVRPPDRVLQGVGLKSPQRDPMDPEILARVLASGGVQAPMSDSDLDKALRKAMPRGKTPEAPSDAQMDAILRAAYAKDTTFPSVLRASPYASDVPPAPPERPWWVPPITGGMVPAVPPERVDEYLRSQQALGSSLVSGATLGLIQPKLPALPAPRTQDEADRQREQLQAEAILRMAGEFAGSSPTFGVIGRGVNAGVRAVAGGAKAAEALQVAGRGAAGLQTEREIALAEQLARTGAASGRAAKLAQTATAIDQAIGEAPTIERIGGRALQRAGGSAPMGALWGAGHAVGSGEPGKIPSESARAARDFAAFAGILGGVEGGVGGVARDLALGRSNKEFMQRLSQVEDAALKAGVLSPEGGENPTNAFMDALRENMAVVQAKRGPKRVPLQESVPEAVRRIWGRGTPIPTSGETGMAPGAMPPPPPPPGEGVPPTGETRPMVMRPGAPAPTPETPKPEPPPAVAPRAPVIRPRPPETIGEPLELTPPPAPDTRPVHELHYDEIIPKLVDEGRRFLASGSALYVPSEYRPEDSLAILEHPDDLRKAPDGTMEAWVGAGWEPITDEDTLDAIAQQIGTVGPSAYRDARNKALDKGLPVGQNIPAGLRGRWEQLKAGEEVTFTGPEALELNGLIDTPDDLDVLSRLETVRVVQSTTPGTGSITYRLPVELPPAVSAELLPYALMEDFRAGRAFTRKTLLARVEELTRTPVGEDQNSVKAIEEAVEGAVVRTARQIAADPILDAKQKFERLKTLYEQQPKLQERTADYLDESGDQVQGSIARQAYSTPIPLAFAVNEWATRGDSLVPVFEGSAGHGALTVGSEPSVVMANELDQSRAGSLRAQGISSVYQEDATTFVENHPAFAGRVPAVVMNPPFGRKDLGSAPLAGSTIESDQLEHKIAADNLLAMKDDGRAVIITGGGLYFDPLTGRPQKEPSWQDRAFLSYLNQRYNVAHVIEVTKAAASRVYGKQGAAWPIRIIAIDGRRPAVDESRIFPREREVEYASTVDQIREQLAGEARDIGRPTFVPRTEDAGVAGGGRGPGGSPPGVVPAGSVDVGTTGGVTGGGGGDTGSVPPAGPGARPEGVAPGGSPGSAGSNLPGSVGEGPALADEDEAAEIARIRELLGITDEDAGEAPAPTPPEASTPTPTPPARTPAPNPGIPPPPPVRKPRAPRTGATTRQPKGERTPAPSPGPMPPPIPRPQPSPSPEETPSMSDADLLASIPDDAKAALEEMRDAFEQGSGPVEQAAPGRAPARRGKRRRSKEHADPTAQYAADGEGNPVEDAEALQMRKVLKGAYALTQSPQFRGMRAFGMAVLKAAGEKFRAYLLPMHTSMVAWPEGKPFNAEAMNLLIRRAVAEWKRGNRSYEEMEAALIAKIGAGLKPYMKSVFEAVRAWPTLKEDGGDGIQVPYLSASRGPQSGSLTPIRMAPAVEKALRELTDEVGDIDQWVAGQLGFADAKTLWNKPDGEPRLNASQIDSIALAVAANRRKEGIIIGHQTGQGKGRIAAAMLRWAILQGKKPIFVTERAQLYTDLWRDWLDTSDWQDVNAGDERLKSPRIWVFNTRDKDSTIRYEPGPGETTGKAYKNAIYGGVPASSDADAPEFDILFTTYSQFNKALLDEKGEPVKASWILRLATDRAPRGDGTRQRPSAANIRAAIRKLRPATAKQSWLMKLARDSYVILDESHNSAGESNTGFLFQNMTDVAAGVTYSSATYAKTPAALGVYQRTILGKFPGVSEALAKGGVALQQVVARMLAAAGQMVRQEMDASQIQEFNSHVDGMDDEGTLNERGRQQIALIDGATSVMRMMLGLDKYAANAVAEVDDPQIRVRTADGILAPESISFSSVSHYLIDQALLSLKLQAAVEQAVGAHERGHKPVVTLNYTNMAALDDLLESGALKMGTWVPRRGFDMLIERQLNNLMAIKVEAPNSTPQNRKYITWQWRPGTDVFYNTAAPSQVVDMSGEAWEEWKAYYGQVLAELRKSDLSGMPLSPVDAIRDGLEKAGISVEEITGRQYRLETQGNRMRVVPIPTDRLGRRGIINRFNSGQTRAVLFNAAGATGISLHASPRFDDKSPRHMVMVQPSNDINMVMQAYGRINRLGQVVGPFYTNIFTALPAELRLRSILMRQMASLNANTTGGKKSAVTLRNTADMMNAVGDRLNVEWLRDNQSFAVSLVGQRRFDALVGEPYTDSNGKTHERAPAEDGLRSFTGKLALAPVADQERYWAELEEEYAREIARLDARGENPFIAKNYDLQARRVKRKVLVAGPDKGNPLEQGVFMDKVSVVQTRKPYPAAKIEDLIAEARGKLMPWQEDVERRATAWQAIMEGRLPEAEERNAAQAKKAAEEAAKPKKKGRKDDEGEGSVDYVALLKRMQENFEKDVQALTGILERFEIGRAYTMKREGGTDQPAVFLGAIFPRFNEKRNTLRPAKLELRFAVPTPDREISLTVDELQRGLVKSESRGEGIPGDWESYCPQGGREDRYVYTGNLLLALDKARQLPDQEVATITYEDGETQDVILLPRWFGENPVMRERSLSLAEIQSSVRTGQTVESDQRTRAGEPLVALRPGEYPDQHILSIAGVTAAVNTFANDRALMNMLVPNASYRRQFEKAASGRYEGYVTVWNTEFAVNRLQALDVTFSTTEEVPFDEYVGIDQGEGEGSDVSDVSGRSGDLGQDAGDQEAPRGKTPDRIAVAPLPGGARIHPRDIVLQLSRELRHRVNVGRTARRAPGSYSPSSGAVTIRWAGNLDLTAHELAGHMVDDFHLLALDDDSFDDELRTLWAYGSSPPAGLGQEARLRYLRAEGVAEFVRAYTVNPDQAQAQAPDFFAHFESTIPAGPLKSVRQFGTQVRRWAGQSGRDTMLSNVGSVTEERVKVRLVDGIRERVRQALEGDEAFHMGPLDHLQEAFLDDKAPILKGVKLAREMRGSEVDDPLPSEDTEMLLRTWYGLPGKVEEIFERGVPVWGQESSVRAKGTEGGVPGLLKAADASSLEALTQSYDDALALMLAERTITETQEFYLNEETGPARRQKLLDEHTFGGFGAGLKSPVDVAADALRELRASPARLRRARAMAETYRAWADANLRYLVDAGRISQADYELIKRHNLYYVAMNVNEEELQAAGSGARARAYLMGTRLGAVVRNIHEIHGSTKEKVDPYVSLLRATARIVQEADRNHILGTFRDLLTRERGMHEGEAEDLASIGRRVPEKTPTSVPIYVAGESEHWEFHPDILRSIRALGDEMVIGNKVMKLLDGFMMQVSRIIHTGVVYHPKFAFFANPMRDTMQRAVVSPHGASLPRARWSDEEQAGFALSGGAQSGPYMAGRQEYDRMMRRTLRKAAGERESAILLKPLRAYLHAAEVGEQRGRMAEYGRAYRYAKSRLRYSEKDAEVYSAYHARRTGTDWAVVGRALKWVRRYLPFVNAAVQGSRVVAMAVRDRPKQSAIRFFLYVVVPALFVYLLARRTKETLRRWRNLSPERRATCTSIQIGPDMWLHIPKPWELGVAQWGLECALDRLAGNEHALQEFEKVAPRLVMPADQWTLMGPVPRLFAEVGMDWDSFGQRRIVPEYERRMDVWERPGARYASRLGRTLAQLFPTDPRVIDHVVSSIGGHMGRTAEDLSDIGREDKPLTRGRALQTLTGVIGSNPVGNSAAFRRVTEFADAKGFGQGREIPLEDAEAMGLSEALFSVRARGGVNPIRDLREARDAAYAAGSAREKQAATDRLYRMAEAMDRALPRYWRVVRMMRAEENEKRREKELALP